MNQTDEKEPKPEELDAEIDAALAEAKPRKPKYGDAGNLELWEEDEHAPSDKDQ